MDYEPNLVAGNTTSPSSPFLIGIEVYNCQETFPVFPLPISSEITFHLHCTDLVCT